MRAYVVRLIDNQDLVGIFTAESVDQLILFIDEATDPDACEYASLGPGGVYWDSPAIAVPIPEPVSGDNDNEMEGELPGFSRPSIPWHACEMTQGWDIRMFSVTPLRWKRITAEQVVHALSVDEVR